MAPIFMRRADRLFQIVQFLRSRRLTTAQWLAQRLEVSTRTIYRDINDLMLSGVPVEGEAGVGYVLRYKLDLPPLCFDRSELAALELGLRFVHAYTDKQLSVAAESAMAKIRTASRGSQNAELPPSQLFVPPKSQSSSPLMGELLGAIDERHKLQLIYQDEQQRSSERCVWPLGVFFWGPSWTLLAWCELRQDFRNFRLDRIGQCQLLSEHYPSQVGRRLQDYFQQLQQKYGSCDRPIDPLAAD